MEARIQKCYRDRKADTKAIFEEEGGYGNVERALLRVPEGMPAKNWHKAVEYFHTPEHRSRAEANKINRQKQRYANRGGMSSYSSSCFKEVMLAFTIIGISIQ